MATRAGFVMFLLLLWGCSDAISDSPSDGGTCTPTTCAAQGMDCDSISDGCGGTLGCGNCTPPATCGGGGTANVCAQGGPLTGRIELLGDSITCATCYPPFLYDDFHRDGYDGIEFVGTMEMYSGLGVTCAGKSYLATPMNEGHDGWNSSDIANSLPGWLTLLGQGIPDVAVVHVGTNDLWDGASPSDITATLANYTAIVGAYRAVNPSVTVLVAQIIPMAFSTATLAATDALDDAIPGWAAAATTAQSAVVVVDLRTGWDSAALSKDGVHPNEAGSRWMADRVYAALIPLL
jgi:hypothetical protein